MGDLRALGIARDFFAPLVNAGEKKGHFSGLLGGIVQAFSAAIFVTFFERFTIINTRFGRFL